jgi:hypothetical protein
MTPQWKSQTPSTKSQGNPKVSIPKVADAVRWSLDILRLAWDLGFGIWNFHGEVPRRRTAAEALWRAGGCAARDDSVERSS